MPEATIPKANVKTDSIPTELRTRPQWVLWRTVERDGNPTKVPFQPSGREAKSNTPETWSEFDTVLKRFQQGKYDGIGYVFSSDDEFTGVDLDGCRNPETGEVAEWARDVIRRVDTYSEVSPSLTGVKLFLRGTSPFERGKKTAVKADRVCNKAPGVEIYSSGRYFAVTGLKLAGIPATLESRDLAWLRETFWPARKTPKEGGHRPHHGDGAHDRALAYVAKIPRAVSGAGGHDQTFHVACVLVLGFDLSEDDAMGILREYNQRCEPPWSEAELAHKIRSAAEQPGERGYLKDARSEAWKGNGRPQRKDEDQAGERPTVLVRLDESQTINEAIDAISRQPIFQRGGLLVQVVRDADPPRGIARPKGSPQIAMLKFARLRELLSCAAKFARLNAKGEHELCHPPDWVIRAIDARGEWSTIRRMEAVVESPVLRANGSILQTPGYDSETGLLYEPQQAFPEIPGKPTRADAQQALDELLEVVVDFPFAHECHMAAWTAGVLTPIARYAFDGPAPLFLMDANVRGVGKSLLADVVAMIVSGRPMARMTLPENDDEFRKRITALAIAGEPLILTDNVSGRLGSPSLDAALTATSWADRVLGRSEMALSIPLYATWYATANNAVLLADTARRTLHVRLESPEEKPEERSGFKHPELLSWVQKERPRLLKAALLILVGYYEAGQPDMQIKPWGSFEAWSALVRSAVVWAGMDDPGATRQELADTADTEASALKLLLDGWGRIDPDSDGMTVASVLDEIDRYRKEDRTMPEEYEQVRNALIELVSSRTDKPLSPKSVGMKLSGMRRRVIAGRYLDSKRGNVGHLWYVRSTK